MIQTEIMGPGFLIFFQVRKAIGGASPGSSAAQRGTPKVVVYPSEYEQPLDVIVGDDDETMAIIAAFIATRSAETNGYEGSGYEFIGEEEILAVIAEFLALGAGHAGT